MSTTLFGFFFQLFTVWTFSFNCRAFSFSVLSTSVQELSLFNHVLSCGFHVLECPFMFCRSSYDFLGCSGTRAFMIFQGRPLTLGQYLENRPGLFGVSRWGGPNLGVGWCHTSTSDDPRRPSSDADKSNVRHPYPRRTYRGTM